MPNTSTWRRSKLFRADVCDLRPTQPQARQTMQPLKTRQAGVGDLCVIQMEVFEERQASQVDHRRICHLRITDGKTTKSRQAPQMASPASVIRVSSRSRYSR